MSSDFQIYMQARSDLQAAIEHFIRVSYDKDFGKWQIAENISDCVYDTDKDMYKEMQRAMLPMVKEFHFTKATMSADMVEDWVEALHKWEQMKMWRALGG